MYGCSPRRSSSSSWNIEPELSTSAIGASTAGGGMSRPSGDIVQWSWVMASRWWLSVAVTVAPRSNQGASLARSAPASKPTPLPTWPVFTRPYPSGSVTASSAWPGTIMATASITRSRLVIETSFPVSTPSLSAVACENMAALSQVSLVIGCGSSCSQALLANRPSKVLASGAKQSSIPDRPASLASSGAAVCASACELMVSPCSEPAPVSGTIPSASQRSQTPSNDPVRLAGSLAMLLQYFCSSACVPTSPSPTKAASTSASVRPPQSGATSGCTMVTTPSVARPSPQDSSTCAAGTK